MTREDLAKLFIGTGAELGVAEGDYSAVILSNPAVGCLYSIDRWSDHHDTDEYERAMMKLQHFGKRSIIIREPFKNAVERFPDSYFDFLYLDGYAHTGQEHGKTFEQWYPKLKPGGILSGHDYSTRYQANIVEVDWFALKYDLKLHFTEEDELPSWFAYKK